VKILLELLLCTSLISDINKLDEQFKSQLILYNFITDVKVPQEVKCGALHTQCEVWLVSQVLNVWTVALRKITAMNNCGQKYPTHLEHSFNM
jgi:hypothetical protein